MTNSAIGERQMFPWQTRMRVFLLCFESFPMATLYQDENHLRKILGERICYFVLVAFFRQTRGLTPWARAKTREK
jgi:hypothetical protein